ncbi:cell division protein FtsA [Candidatus Nomurabacteria bacterium]|nr:cell division protein FtsA [Candidatus Nomurabacteria bacterium]
MKQEQHILAGIDIGTHTTRVVVCAMSESTQPQLLGVGSAPTRGLRHGYIIDRQQATASLRAALADAQKNTGIHIAEALVAIGGVSLRAEHIAATVDVAHHSGEVSQRDIDQALDRCEDVLLAQHNNIRIIHRIPLKFKLDNEMVLGNPLGLIGKKLSVKALFITVFDHHAEDLIDVVHNAGVEVFDMVAAPLAIHNSVLSYNDRKAGAAVIDIGSETSSIMVFDDARPISLEVFPIGSTDITNDIALGFQISLDEAEQLKKGTLQPSRARKYPKGRIDEIIEARISDIAELFTRHLQKTKKSHLLPAGLVITGGGSGLESIASFLKSELKLPVRLASDGIVQQSKRKTMDASWYVAYGLCWYAQSEKIFHIRRGGVLGNFLKNTASDMGSWLKQLLP